MARLSPFRALRPRPAEAPRIAAVPYDVVNADEARALADANPLSFLRVSRAEIELPPGTDPYSDAVYDRAAAFVPRSTIVSEDIDGNILQVQISADVDVDALRAAIGPRSRLRPNGEYARGARRLL